MRTPEHKFNKDCYCERCLEKKLKDTLLTLIAKLHTYLSVKHEDDVVLERILNRYEVTSLAELSLEELEEVILILAKRLEDARKYEPVGV